MDPRPDENNDLLSSPFEWPKFKCYANTKLELILAFFDLLLFVLPCLSNFSLWIRGLIAFGILLCPCFYCIFVWIIQTMRTITYRVHFYPLLYFLSTDQAIEISRLRKEFTKFILKEKKCFFEIEKMAYCRNELYGVIHKVDTQILEKNSKLMIIDLQDEYPMGIFEITEIRENDYYAIGIEDIDPVWLAYVRDCREVTVNPNLIAVYLGGMSKND